MKVFGAIFYIALIMVFLACKREKISYSSQKGNSNREAKYLEKTNEFSLSTKDTIYKWNKDSTEINAKIYKKSGDFYKEILTEGALKAAGPVTKEGQLNGLWTEYNLRGEGVAIKEYKIIQASSYKNQVWDLNNLEKGSYNYLVKVKDTIQVGERIKGFVIIENSFFAEGSSKIKLLLPRGNDNFNEDFSNVSEIEYGVIPNIKEDETNRKWFESISDIKFPYIAAFASDPIEKRGQRIFRVIVEEENTNPEDLNYKKIRRFYIEIPVIIQ